MKVPLRCQSTIPARSMREVVHFADRIAVKMIEPAVLRPELLVGMTEMPLAHHRCTVACLLQGLRQGPLVGRQAIGMVRKDHQRLQAVAHRIAPRHQRRARRRADRHAVEGFEPHAALRKLVDIRRLDIAPAVAEIGIAEIVGQDHDDVGTLLLGFDEAAGRQQVNRSSGSTVSAMFRFHGLYHCRDRGVSLPDAFSGFEILLLDET